jgi:hypothetical protein
MLVVEQHLLYQCCMVDKRTYADRREYLKLAVTKRRRTLQLRAVALMEGSYVLCGYNKHPGILDFHHLDPSTKSFGVSNGGFSRSWASIETELRQCILVCANCHREIERGLVTDDLTKYLLQGV